MAKGSTTAVLAALTANLAIAVLKFVGFLLTGSSAMLAEAVHSVADTANQVLLLIGGKRSDRAPDRRHPFGYGQARYVYSLLVSVLLFSLGGLFALFEAYEKWRKPEPIDSTWWWVPIVILLGAIVSEGLSLRTAVKQSNRIRSRGWFAFLRRTKQPELPVVLLEDSAAIVGLSFALAAVIATLATGNSIWDALGSALIGLLLVTVAVFLAIEMASLLIGEAATEQNSKKVEEAIDHEPRGRLVSLKTLHLGPEALLVAARISFPAEDSARDVFDGVRRMENRIRQDVPIVSDVYLHPEAEDSDRNDGSSQEAPD